MRSFLTGDVHQMLRTLPRRSVQCVITSPPYWGLRDYGVDGQIGLESTPDAYVASIVSVFRKVRRVLRDDGTLWLNLGDSYAGSWGAQSREHAGKHAPNVSALSANQVIAAQRRSSHTGSIPEGSGLKLKDLVGIPWRVAFALQADGWYLRSDVIWAKAHEFCPGAVGSVMPESTRDRPTRAHEYLFLLTKSRRYFYDYQAGSQPGIYPAGTRAAKGSGTREGNRRGARKKDVDGGRIGSSNRTQRGGFQDRWDDGYASYSGRRNLRDVWFISPKPYKEAHFATFPPSLVEPCIRLGTSTAQCSACGTPHRHVVDRTPIPDDVKAQFAAARKASQARTGREDGHTQRKPNFKREVIGDHYEPACDCHAEAEPQIVLDPFGGSGTVGEVADALGRRFILIDLNSEYTRLQRRRVRAARQRRVEAL